jgi:hypothetical protein
MPFFTTIEIALQLFLRGVLISDLKNGPPLLE